MCKQAKKRAAKSDSLAFKSRNNHSDEVGMEQSLALGVPVHWAEFYADSQECQEGHKSY
jgi:hypothetical protein